MIETVLFPFCLDEGSWLRMIDRKDQLLQWLRYEGKKTANGGRQHADMKLNLKPLLLLALAGMVKVAARVRRTGSRNFSAGASSRSSRPKRSIGVPSFDSAFLQLLCLR